MYYFLYYLVTFTRKGEILKIYLKIRIACLQVPENVTTKLHNKWQSLLVIVKLTEVFYTFVLFILLIDS